MDAYYDMHVRHRTPSREITIRTLYIIGTHINIIFLL